jgi:transposase
MVTSQFTQHELGAAAEEIHCISGFSWRRVARDLGVSLSTVRRWRLAWRKKRNEMH